MSCCVNRGGIASLLRLNDLPVLQQETEIDPASLPALDIWRARPGEALTALAPDQTAFRVRLTQVSASRVMCIPFERLWPSPESPLAIEVYQAIPDKERFETILQKLTELGVSRVVPMQTERSLTLAERDAGQKKSHRWPEVLLRAARQCRRAMVPELHAVVPFSKAISLAGCAELGLMLHAGDTRWSLQDGIGALQPRRVALLVGPEGGFSETECAQARDAGILPVTLGPRILRTETAAIVGAAILQNRIGDLG